METQINIRSIEAFKNISSQSVSKIAESAEIKRYPIGRRICDKTIIPNQILCIISGEARVLHEENSESKTISKYGENSFIGLASILTAKGLEDISASSEVITFGLSDKIILELYKEEIEFRNWCDTNFQIQELYEIYWNLQKQSSQKNNKESMDSLLKNSLLNVIGSNQKSKGREGFIQILSSDNVINKRPMDIINDNEIIETRGPLPARIFYMPIKIYNSLIGKGDISKDKKLIKNNIEELEIKDARSLPETTVEKIGQYSPKKDFKLIKAKGSIREAQACLQMISNELGLPFKPDFIEKILRDTVIRGKKPSLQLIGNIASNMGLYTSTVKLNTKFASRLPIPSMITWGDSFAVVTKSNSTILEIASPSEGIIQLLPEQISDAFEKGFIELLILEKNEQTPEVNFGIQWLLPSIKRYKGVLAQVLLASFVVQLFGLANPLMIQIIIDKVISQRSLDTLQILGFALVFVTIVGGVISSLRTFLFNETTNRIDTRLGAEVIDHLLKLPLGYFDKRPVGELGNRISELEKIRNFLTGQALTTILDAIFSLIYIVVMVVYSWLLTLLALGVVPIQIMITVIGTPLIRRQIREAAQENAKTQSHLVEVLTGIQTVKAQNVESVSRWKWQELYGKYISKSFQRTITGTALTETSQVLQQLSQLVVLWVGATLVLKGQLSLGQLIAFRIISGYVTQPLLRLSTIWQNIQELRVSFERLGDIVDTPEETSILDKSKIPLPSIKGFVEFEDVSFRFLKGQPSVLNKINLKIKQGQFVGIVGQSGSGKSTLMKLLPRLYKPQSGRVFIDGYDVDKVELYSLRRQIGIVPQEPLLFAGNINDNIALTDPDAESDAIVNAAKIANAHEFIMTLRDGYSTDIGERGAGLSGGQKQRLAIARTLLSNPKLLILDEATSALDYETEAKVCEGLKAACTNSTVLFITHRLSTVKKADLIVMLHQGCVVETGTHDELMKLKGRYYALYLQQESN